MFRISGKGSSYAAMLALSVWAGGCTAPPPEPGFITENVAPPRGAKTEAGDVPRTKYGRPYQYAMLGQPVPDFTVQTADGETLTSEDLVEGWTVLEVWGIWCPDCVADGPYVQALSDAIQKDPELTFMTMHSPPTAERADEAFGKYSSVAAYQASRDYYYPYVLDLDASAKMSLDLPWIPSYLLIDPEGIIRGYRSDLSVGGASAVDQFVADAHRVMNASKSP